MFNLIHRLFKNCIDLSGSVDREMADTKRKQAIKQREYERQRERIDKAFKGDK